MARPRATRQGSPRPSGGLGLDGFLFGRAFVRAAQSDGGCKASIAQRQSSSPANSRSWVQSPLGASRPARFCAWPLSDTFSEDRQPGPSRGAGVVGLGPLPSRPQRFDLSARGGPSSFRVAAILGLLSPRLWLALGSHHSRFSAKTKRFRQIGNQFRQKINLGPMLAEKQKSQTKAHFGRKNTVPKKTAGARRNSRRNHRCGRRRRRAKKGRRPPPPATRQARCEADRPSRLSRPSDRRQAAPPREGRGRRLLRGGRWRPGHAVVCLGGLMGEGRGIKG